MNFLVSKAVFCLRRFTVDVVCVSGKVVRNPSKDSEADGARSRGRGTTASESRGACATGRPRPTIITARSKGLPEAINK